jgi:hypothetical protein
MRAEICRVKLVVVDLCVGMHVTCDTPKRDAPARCRSSIIPLSPVFPLFAQRAKIYSSKATTILV